MVLTFNETDQLSTDGRLAGHEHVVAPDQEAEPAMPRIA